MSYDQELIESAIEYLADGSSLRKTSQKYGISHVTLRERFINDLPSINPELSELVNQKKEERRIQNSIENPEVVDRVNKSLALMLSRGLTISEIASELDSTEFTIYRDLVTRLPRLDVYGDDIVEKVKDVLKEHSMKNLKQNKGTRKNA